MTTAGDQNRVKVNGQNFSSAYLPQLLQIRNTVIYGVTTVGKKQLPDIRDERGRFGAGNAGRPKGSTNKTAVKAKAMAVAGDVLTGDDYREIVLKMAERAKAGDAAAAKLILPRWKSVVKPVRFDMDVTDPLTAARDVANAIARGEVPPDVGAMIIGSLSGIVKIEEVSEMREQLAALMAQMAELLENRR